MRQIAREEAAELRAARRVSAARTNAAIRGAGGAFRGMAGVAGGIAALGGGLAITSGISSQIDITKRASMLANQAGDPRRKAAIAGAVGGVSGATQSQAMGALEEWQTVTGDLDLGIAQLQRFSDIALATGTDMSELSAAAGNAFNSIKDGIQDPQKRLEALDAILRSAAAQGALGAVEIKQMATEMSALASSGVQFGKNAPESIMRSIAMAQVARAKGGAPSAAEAVTAVERFGSDVMNKRKILKSRYGVDVFSKDNPNQLRGQEDLVKDILSATGGNVGTLGDIFGERGLKVMRGFANVYNAAERSKKGSGIAAVEREFSGYMGAATSDAEIQRRVASRLQDPDMQLQKTIDNMNKAIGSQMIPVLNELIPKMQELTPAIGNAAGAAADLATYFMSNPIKGAGAIVGAGIVKEVAGSGLSAILSGEGSKMQRALGGVTVALVALEAGILAIDYLFKEAQDAQKKKLQEDVGTANLYGGLHKNLTPEEKQKLENVQDKNRKRIQELQSQTGTQTVMTPYGPQITMGNKLTAEQQQEKSRLEAENAQIAERMYKDFLNATVAAESLANSFATFETQVKSSGSAMTRVDGNRRDPLFFD